MRTNSSESFNSLSLMGLGSIKQDTQTHRTNQAETNRLIEMLSIQVNKLDVKVDKLDESIQNVNVALSNLINVQTQANSKAKDLADKMDKVWKERWWYRILPLSILGFFIVGLWQVASNWDSILSFFTAMNTFFQQAK